MSTGPKAPPAVAEVWSWTGFYVGGKVGWADERFDWLWDISPNVPGVPPAGVGVRKSGVAYGGQAGYQYQMGSWVFGIEGSVTAFNFGNDYQTRVNAFQVGLNKDFSAQSIQWIGKVTPKLGYAVGRWMGYVKGGYAFSESDVALATFFSPNGLIQTQSSGKLSGGWTVGGGLDYLITNNVIVGLDYNYTKLGGQNRLLVSTFNNTVPSNHFLGDLTTNEVMLRVDFKFNPGSTAVVAKY